MKGNNIPEIRFPEFDTKWTQHKLGEFLEDYIKKTTVQNQYPVLTSSQKHGIILQEDYFSNRQVTTDNNIGYFILPKGYITYRSRSDNNVFVFNRNDLIDNGIISYFYPVFKITNGDSDFFLKMLNSTTKKQVAAEAVGTGQKVLSLKKLKNIDVTIPVIKEQAKIGEFFKQLDRIISLHQQELDALKQTKQGFLQKMFPKEGETVPELRFPEFNEEWKAIFLKDVATFINGRAYKQPELLSSGKYKVLRVGNFYTNKNWYYSDLELDEKYYANTGDLLYTWSASFGPHIWQGEKVIYHYHIWKVELKSGFDKQFAVQLFEYDKAKILNDKNGSTMVHITKKGMEDKRVLLPSIEEQIQIGNFFKKIDGLIALQQQELDALKQTKKAFLQKMFV